MSVGHRPCGHESREVRKPVCTHLCWHLWGFNLSSCGCSAERAPQHSFYKSFPFWLLCNERCFLARTRSPLLSACCHSELLAVRSFSYRETEFFYCYCVTHLRLDWVTYEEVFRESTSREDKEPALFSVLEEQFVWYVSMYSNAASKVARYLKHSPAVPYELSFVQIPKKQAFWPKSAPAQQ